MTLEFKIGKEKQTVDVDKRYLLGILKPGEIPPGPSGEEAVRHALKYPAGTPQLREIVCPGEKVAVITSDITRPLPTHILMPFLLEELYEAGVKREDITLIFALGSHRKHSNHA